MSLLTEQLSSAAQNQLAKQIAVFQAWSQLAFGGLEKLITLNFNTAKQSLENANSVTHELFAVKQAQELLDLSRSQAQPQLEKILSYGRELAAISIDTRTELWQIVSKQGNAEIVATVAIAKPALKAAPAAVTKPVVTKPVVAKPAVTKPAVTKPVVAKPAVTKPAVKKLAAKPIAATKQLTLLAEPEVKTAKTPAKPKAVAKVAEKPVAKVAAKPAAKAPATKTVIKPVPAKTEAVKKPVKTTAAAAVEATPAAPVPVITPAEPLPAATTAVIEKTLEKKTSPAKKPAAKTEAADSATPVKTDSAPAASTEKKSAVKFPFPATSNLKKAPGFPANNGKPAYKAKSSAATGAKKPVRQ
ncbi:hypothetical protein UNDKW_3318 [Undibacterium sp. KW1]|uniref:phasin family protein n=1 Tax=Undibacterium sp. KW1 TaxID=2058624 RepID=UPI001331E643|nr:TIGR01841 family phasin [Undibacterium sp. KW1]BBB61591.1 hypothetical protein UNDKW_3318 [Undibacterium sp. KW1]